MRNIMIFAAIMIGLGTFMANMADKWSASTALAKGTTASSPQDKFFQKTSVSPSGARSLSIPRDFRGQFQAVGRIDGQHMNFMIDTGATVVALNEKSAA